MYRWGSVGPLPDWFLTLKLADWPLHILVGRSGKSTSWTSYGRFIASIRGRLVVPFPPGSPPAFRQMFMALEKHLDPQYTNLIRQKIARACLDLAITARSNYSRWQTVRYLLSLR